MQNNLADFAYLLSYPAEGYLTKASSLLQNLESIDSEAFFYLKRFLNLIQSCNEDELREIYTRTFDLKSLTCLDVGFILFGEDYKRGAFLVEVQRIMRSHGLSPGSELPDHFPNVLKLLSVMAESQEYTELIEKICLPALSKIKQDFDRQDNAQNIYQNLINGLFLYLGKQYKMNDLILQGEPI